MASYVTGSAKTSLIAQDRKFDCFTQTQSFMNALSNFNVIVDRSKVVCFCCLLFQAHEWSGVLMEPWLIRSWLCVAVQLRGIGQ